MNTEILQTKSFYSMHLAVCLLLSGCSSSGGSTIVNVADLTGHDRYNGTWLLDCVLDITTANEPTPEYITELVVLDTGNFELDFDTFRDSSCIESFGPNEKGSITGTYTLGSDLVSTSGLTATEFDVNLPSSVQLNLIYRDGNIMYLGVDPDEDIRPDTINFDEPYLKQ